MLKLRGPTLMHLVLKGQPLEKLKLRISSKLWLMLQEEEGESRHWLNGQKKEAIFPLPPRPSPTLSSALALLLLHLKGLKP